MVPERISANAEQAIFAHSGQTVIRAAIRSKKTCGDEAAIRL
jgi:hypothetical protein